MSSPGRKAEQFFEFIAAIAVLALMVWGAWQVRKYLRHEREQGSVTYQLRRIDEEFQKAGFVKGSNGAWGLPEKVGTNTTGSQRLPDETNKVASGEK
jgi:hypothetical protein